MPFDIKNGVACFQLSMDEFIAEEEFSKTYAYLDNITVCGNTQEEHDHNLARFLAAAKKKNSKFNQENAHSQLLLLIYSCIIYQMEKSNFTLTQ